VSDAGKPLHERRLWEFQIVRDVLAILCIVGVLLLGARLSFITAPLLVGLGLAYLFEPVILALCRWFPRLNRLRAVLLLLAAGVIGSVGLAALVVPPMVRQGLELSANAGRYAVTARDWLTAAQRPAWLREQAPAIEAGFDHLGLVPARQPAVAAPEQAIPAPSSAVPDEDRVRAIVREELERAQPAAGRTDLLDRLREALTTLGGGLATLVGGVFTMALFLGLAAVTAVSCMLRWPELLELGRSLIPERARERVFGLVGRMDAAVAAFVRGRLTVAAIVGALYALGWSLVGVPYGLVLGLIVGVLSIVPYLAAVGLPAAWILLAVSLITQPESGGWYIAAGEDGLPAINWWLVLILPWLVNLIAQSVEDYVLNPIIQGRATELHPLVIMLAVLAGGSLAGLYGMLLAVPAAACLKILLTAEVMPRLRAWAGARAPGP
jgi:predicted PurR-regulated permease PerM